MTRYTVSFNQQKEMGECCFNPNRCGAMMDSGRVFPDAVVPGGLAECPRERCPYEETSREIGTLLGERTILRTLTLSRKPLEKMGR